MKHKCIKTAVLITGVTAITMFSGCSSCSRSLKSLSSDIDGGLNRTVTVYDYNGGKIKSWSGKFDVSESENEVYFDDSDGKRVIMPQCGFGYRKKNESEVIKNVHASCQ